MRRRAHVGFAAKRSNHHLALYKGAQEVCAGAITYSDTSPPSALPFSRSQPKRALAPSSPLSNGRYSARTSVKLRLRLSIGLSSAPEIEKEDINTLSSSNFRNTR